MKIKKQSSETLISLEIQFLISGKMFSLKVKLTG